MGVIGLSLIVASVVLLCLRPPQWLPRFFFATFGRQRIGPPPTKPSAAGPEKPKEEGEDDGKDEQEAQVLAQKATPIPSTPAIQALAQEQPSIQESKSWPLPNATKMEEKVEEECKEPVQGERQANGAPKTPAPTIKEPSIPETESSSSSDAAATTDQQGEEREDGQITPKATAMATTDSVPSLVLPEVSKPKKALPTPSLVLPSSSTTPASTPTKAPEARQPSRIPSPKIKGSSKSPPSLQPQAISDQQATNRSVPPSALMPPPPVPKPRPSGIPQPTTPSSSSPSPVTRRIPTLDPSPNRERNLPVPRRGAAPGRGAMPSSSSLGVGGLAPPPTHSSIPKKPSRQVTLEPGHSPMDWARLAQSPTSDLRGVPPNTPYLRVTPTMLKQMNGRKGRDAWSVYGGKVYNVSPYIPFHPGGGGELLRGAGKDATRLFGEVHPWVNYETMLSACLIGILVEEHETENKMEEMD